MERREFLKKTFSAALFGAIARFSGNLHAAPAAGKETAADGTPDIVAVRGGTPAEMFQKAIHELGGMSRFVKKGQVVTIKPRIATAPLVVVTTSSEFVSPAPSTAVLDLLVRR